MGSWFCEYAQPDLSGRISKIMGDQSAIKIDGRLNRENAREVAISVADDRKHLGLTHYRLVRGHRYLDIPEARDDEWQPIPGVERNGAAEKPRTFTCERCKRELLLRTTKCSGCGACYNSWGQRLRDDWQGNPSLYDDGIGDMEGFELQHADDE
jgi:hypothetical protein